MIRLSQLSEDFGSVSGTRCRYKGAKAHRDKAEKDAESGLISSLCPSVLLSLKLSASADSSLLSQNHHRKIRYVGRFDCGGGLGLISHWASCLRMFLFGKRYWPTAFNFDRLELVIVSLAGDPQAGQKTLSHFRPALRRSSILRSVTSCGNGLILAAPSRENLGFILRISADAARASSSRPNRI